MPFLKASVHQLIREKVLKILTASLLICALASSYGSAFAKGGGHSSSGTSSNASHSVRGYVTKSGTYVAPHHATNPDSTKTTNWSQKGNVNPYTGKEGTKSN